MGDKIIKLVIFGVGVGIGSAVTYKLVKTKYEQIANEEINDIRDYYHSLHEDEAIIEDESEPTKAETVKHEDKPDISEYVSRTRDYTSYSDTQEEKVEEPIKSSTSPAYVITPDEYSQFSDYETASLTLFADGYLVDDIDDEPIENVEETIGWENLNEIGKYEEDIIHIRNDELKIDYEITRDLNNYKD